MGIRFVRVNADNFEECIQLRPKPEQEKFIASNVFSIAQCFVHSECHPMCIYAGHLMVGFVMYGWERKDDTMWVSRMMIDARFQRRGYGRQVVERLLEKIREDHGVDEVYLSLVPENEVAAALYEGAGFLRTGEMDEGENVFVFRFRQGVAC